MGGDGAHFRERVCVFIFTEEWGFECVCRCVCAHVYQQLVWKQGEKDWHYVYSFWAETGKKKKNYINKHHHGNFQVLSALVKSWDKVKRGIIIDYFNEAACDYMTGITQTKSCDLRELRETCFV